MSEDWEEKKDCYNCYWFNADKAGRPQECGLLSVNCINHSSRPSFTPLHQGLREMMRQEEAERIKKGGN